MRNQKKFYLYDTKTDDPTLLSAREVECISHTLRGRTIKQMAKMLRLSHRTAEFYIRRLKNKLHCRTRSELIEKILTGTLTDPSEFALAQSQVVSEHQQIHSILNKLEHNNKNKKENKARK